MPKVWIDDCATMVAQTADCALCALWEIERSDAVPRRREPDELPRHRIQILLPQDLYEALRQAARANNRSINGEVVTAVQEYLRRHQVEHASSRQGSETTCD